MSARGLAVDGLICVLAGALASATMTPVTSAISRLQSEQSTRRESRASYGVADEVALERVAATVGFHPTPRQRAVGKTLMHSSLGIGLAPVYMLLRRSTALSPGHAGLAAGLGLFVVVDEGLNPVLGFTPPPRAYPLITHVRGLVGHLVLGLSLAAAVEAGWALARRRP